MATTSSCLILGAIVTLMLVCKATSSRDRHIQSEIDKRIFCNFYGCGQKRSTGDLTINLPDRSTEDMHGIRRPNKADLLAEELDTEEDFNPKYILENLHTATGHRQSLDALTGGRRENLVTSPEGEKYLHAAALWEALKHRLAVQVPNHRIAKRNTKA